MADVFSLWNNCMKEAYNFADFTNTFHPTIRFTYESKARHSHKNQQAVKSKVEKTSVSG